MAATNTGLQTNRTEIIASLAQKLGIAEREVGEIYGEAFARIAAQARITSFVGVLALHDTRTMLQSAGRQTTLS